MGVAGPRLPAAGAGRHLAALAQAAGAHRRLHRHERDLAVLRLGARGPALDPGARPGRAPGDLDRVQLREHGRRRHQADDPDRPAGDLDDADHHGDLGADPPLLDQLPGLRPRLRALLRLPQLLRLLDAPARRGGELRDPDRRLGRGRRGVLPADLVLVPPGDRHRGGHQGVRDQRGRRRRARARHLLHLQAHRHAGLPQDVRQGPATSSPPTRATSSRGACC